MEIVLANLAPQSVRITGVGGRKGQNAPSNLSEQRFLSISFCGLKGLRLVLDRDKFWGGEVALFLKKKLLNAK